MSRQKPPLSVWIAENRKRLGWKADELAARLRDAGYEAADTTVRTWEAGRTPRPETVEALERLFDSPAPRETGLDRDALVAAIAEQTAAMRELTAAISALVGQSSRSDVVERRLAVAEDLAAYLEERREGIARAEEAERALRAPEGEGARASRSAPRVTTG